MQALLLNKTKFLIYLFLLFSLTYSKTTKAQFISATLGINGLTCSLCSFGVERELYKLDFIEQVKMDLNQNIATILFKSNNNVYMKKLIAAVYDAGFSVGYTQAVFSFDSISVDQKFSFLYQGERYNIIDHGSQNVTGEQIIRFLDKNFVVQKEYKIWEEKIKLSNKKTPALYHIRL